MVVESEKNIQYVPIEALTMPIANERKSYRLANKVNLGFGEFILQQLDMISGKRPKGTIEDITHFIVVDLSTQQGLKTLIELASRFDSGDEENEVDSSDTENIRFAVIHNPKCTFGEPIKNVEGGACFTLYNDFVNIVSRTFSTKKYLKFLKFVLPAFVRDNSEEEKKIDILSEINKHVRIGTTKEAQFIELWKSTAWKSQVLSVHRYLIEEAFQGVIQRGHNYIITNGRVTELPADLDQFPASGFRLLEAMEREKTKKIKEIILSSSYQHVIDQEPFQSIGKKIDLFKTELFMRVSSVLLHRQKIYNRFTFSYYTDSNKNSSTPISLDVILDPLSKTSRKLSPIIFDLLRTFSNDLIDYNLSFNPSFDLSELPISSFYRYAVDSSSISYDHEGYLIPPSITFTNVPKHLLFSLHIDAPSSWMVQSSVSKYDLDNIILNDLSDGEDILYAEFLLKNLVIHGSALEMDDYYSSPRGTEILLRNYNHEIVKDTIVMANYGYFQLQANPGIWYIDLADGRSSKVYSIIPSSSSADEGDDNKELLLITSFAVKEKSLYLRKNPEMKEISVLDLPNKSKHDQTIHIFSLASGHVYERFLKIMMLSVIKNTQSPVKFWFVENFLSPKFKNFLDSFKEQYSFDVELISYQWPSWLHAQTEKQRVIWAYKILFLDVLFPLDVNRVIFVDADLVVRADLREVCILLFIYSIFISFFLFSFKS